MKKAEKRNWSGAGSTAKIAGVFVLVLGAVGGLIEVVHGTRNLDIRVKDFELRMHDAEPIPASQPVVRGD